MSRPAPVRFPLPIETDGILTHAIAFQCENCHFVDRKGEHAEKPGARCPKCKKNYWVGTSIFLAPEEVR